jgi:hypothetical protein
MDTFINHIATVEDYMRQTSKSDREAASHLFVTFTKYIISYSIGKLERRIRSGTASGVISGFMMAEEFVQASYNRYGEEIEQSQRRDTAFGITLLDIPIDDLQSMMDSHPVPLKGLAPLTKLKMAFKKILASSTLEPGETAYNKETCVEFHHLVTAILYGYRSSVFNFYEAKKNSSNNMLSCAITLWGYLNILWRIAHSKMLHFHLTILNRSYALRGVLQVKGAKLNESGENGEGTEELHSLYVRWFHIQPSHYNGLEVLSAWCKANAKEININLVVVRSPSALNSPRRLVGSLKETLHRISDSDPSTITQAEHLQAAECHAKVRDAHLEALAANDKAFQAHTEAAQSLTPSSTARAQAATVEAKSATMNLFNPESAYQHMEKLLIDTPSSNFTKTKLLKTIFAKTYYQGGNFHCEALLFSLREALQMGKVPQDLKSLIEVLPNSYLLDILHVLI